ncbi:MAG TPA: hypothetical protein VD932_05465 [Aquabacterium sp.]|nr:hypothetical protein [Aquabacterium sp.]
MQETAPVPLGLLAVFVLWLGPVVGPYALIAFAAAAGGLVALSKRGEGTRREGAIYLALTIGLCLVVVGPIAWGLDKWLDVPAHVAMAPVAALIGLFRDQLLSMLENALPGLPAALAKVFNLAGTGRSGQ